jgi:hypothetical protein
MALRKRMNSWCRVLHVAADDDANPHIESGKESGRAVGLSAVGRLVWLTWGLMG